MKKLNRLFKERILLNLTNKANFKKRAKEGKETTSVKANRTIETLVNLINSLTKQNSNTRRLKKIL